jgi:serine/threonine-protein kinase
LNRLFRWGIAIALIVLASSGYMALKIVFGSNDSALVPTLIGLSAVEAANQLQGAGLSARIDQVDSSQPEGIVISQSISPGEKTDRGKIVTLRVSRGGAQLRIPDVRGKEFAVAARELNDAGFKIGAVVRVPDQLKQPGTVIAQNPSAPAMVLNSRMVDLLVSEGGAERAETVQVPDLRGQPERQARQIIEQSDLEVAKVITVESNQSPPGTVFRTEPRAGARVPAGRGVTIHIASAPTPDDGQNAAGQSASAPPGAPAASIATAPAGSSGASAAGPARPLAPEASTWNPNQPAPAVGTRPPSGAPQAGNQQPAQQSVPAIVAPATGKIAKVRYQVPPLARSMALRILLNDQSGTKSLREQQVKGGEYITMDAPYTGSATVTVQLGDQQVWQEKYN